MSSGRCSAPPASVHTDAEDGTWEVRLAMLPLWWVMLGAGTGAALITLMCGAAGADESWNRLIVMGTFYAIPLACWWIVLRRCAGSSRGILGEPFSWGLASRAVGVALATFVVHLGWLALLTELDRVPDSWLEPMVETEGAAQEVAWALVAVVLDPPVEELAFRGVLYQRWRRRVHPAWAALGTSLLFGLLHRDVVGMTLLGLALTALVHQTRSLWAPIIAHATNNVIAVSLASDTLSRAVEELPLWVLGAAQLVCLPPVVLPIWRNLRAR